MISVYLDIYTMLLGPDLGVLGGLHAPQQLSVHLGAGLPVACTRAARDTSTSADDP